MMDKGKLRKADIFSGGAIFVFGLWVVGQALEMPMKGSWGGVQNVWFVSPALFPLFVGGMIAVLGALLVRTGLKNVGIRGLGLTLQWLASRDLLRFARSAPVIRFYAICTLFFSYVYLGIPRVDFFLCSILFLSVFITLFHFGDDGILIRLFGCFLAGTVLFAVFVAAGAPAALEPVAAYPNDLFTLVFIAVYCTCALRLSRGDRALRKKFRTTMVLAVAAPFLIGPVFKYLLLVPMPTEGLVVAFLDAVRYWEF